MPQTPPESPDHFHAVRFYQDTASLCHIVATFLGEGLKLGEPALVIATIEQRVGIAAALAADGLDIELFRQAGFLFELDAAETLARFMPDGEEPDRHKFFEVVGGVLQQIAGRQAGRSIRAYGQMVDVLWQAGAHVAAVRVEVLWNQLAATRPPVLVALRLLDGQLLPGRRARRDLPAAHPRGFGRRRVGASGRRAQP